MTLQRRQRRKFIYQVTVLSDNSSIKDRESPTQVKLSFFKNFPNLEYAFVQIVTLFKRRCRLTKTTPTTGRHLKTWMLALETLLSTPRLSDLSFMEFIMLADTSSTVVIQRSGLDQRISSARLFPPLLPLNLHQELNI